MPVVESCLNFYSTEYLPSLNCQKHSFLFFGGERGIRTLDTFPYTHFPGVLLQPLGHLSVNTDLAD